LKFARDLEKFMRTRGGGATTDEILLFFGSKIKPEESAMFREILKELCTHTTTRDGAGRPTAKWHLKPGFR
jgi:hypothetical protein